MKKIVFLFYILLPSRLIAQLPTWAICISEAEYQYVNSKMDGFKVISKRFTFCYNDGYFGFDAGNGYIKVFPLERYNVDVDNKDNVKREFINGKAGVYDEGEFIVTITHSNPGVILIQKTTSPSYAYYIETDDLLQMEIKGFNKRKNTVKKSKVSIRNSPVPKLNIDSLITYGIVWTDKELNSSFQSVYGGIELSLKVNKNGTIESISLPDVRLTSAHSQLDRSLKDRVIKLLMTQLQFLPLNYIDNDSISYDYFHYSSTLRVPAKH